MQELRWKHVHRLRLVLVVIVVSAAAAAAGKFADVFWCILYSTRSAEEQML